MNKAKQDAMKDAKRDTKRNTNVTRDQSRVLRNVSHAQVPKLGKMVSVKCERCRRVQVRRIPDSSWPGQIACMYCGKASLRLRIGT